MTTYRALFAIREFRVLFFVRLFTMVGVVVSSLALGTVMYGETGSPLLTAISLFGGPLVQLGTARYLLASSDLLRPRSAMVAMAAIATATAALQALPGLAWWVRFVILAAGYVAMGATSGTVLALLSDIVPEKAFVLARATMNITVGGMQVLGYAVGAVLLAAFSPTWLFGIAAVVGVVAGALARTGLVDRPARAQGKVVERSRRVNRALLGSPVVRPIYLMMWIPNGLIVGCEALFIPYAADQAGYLFAAGAAGMLTGDIVIGRFVPESLRDRLIVPLRVLLAVPFLAFPLSPPLPVAGILITLSAFGYAAALPLQERLIHHTPIDVRGQAFGLSTTGLTTGQALGALTAGTIAQLLPTTHAEEWTMTTLATLSLTTTALLRPTLHRSHLFPTNTPPHLTPDDA
ncbi:MFS transporter [Actinokineospora cianjurensis]|uniref:Putative MFS family arabinose efflux permease n=1 Tax=Actinokineospora cianjurensis TaxID=585224 RepID=A0A421B3D3_9PSEU|nr:MFS transporter [Actinokineospora cianjurensis]RLK58864.1 putative MFS family arabinose efflux permease [Actinokineospora cianjurensis]